MKEKFVLDCLLIKKNKYGGAFYTERITFFKVVQNGNVFRSEFEYPLIAKVYLNSIDLVYTIKKNYIYVWKKRNIK